MKGTAILFQEENITFIEDIEISTYEQIKEQCGYDHCNCKLDNKVFDLGPVSPVFWHADEVDWDYGY